VNTAAKLAAEAYVDADVQYVSDLSPAGTSYVTTLATNALNYLNSTVTAAVQYAESLATSALAYTNAIVPAGQAAADAEADNAVTWVESVSSAGQSLADAEANNALTEVDTVIDEQFTCAETINTSALAETTAINGAMQAFVAAGVAAVGNGNFQQTAAQQEGGQASPEQLKEALEMALLAQAAYGNQAPPGWQIVEGGVHVDEDSGFKAVVYINNTTGEVVLAFAGTADSGDWWTNFQQGLGGFGTTPAQYQLAMHLAASYKVKYGNKLKLAGHSLGGGLASAAAIVYKIPAVTLNAAGVHPWTLERYSADVTTATQWIDAYRVRGEVLSTMQDTHPLIGSLFAGIGAATVWLMPNGVGVNYWLNATSVDPVSRHMMADVIAGLRQALRN
jgi:hypothetical protein